MTHYDTWRTRVPHEDYTPFYYEENTAEESIQETREGEQDLRGSQEAVSQ